MVRNHIDIPKYFFAGSVYLLALSIPITIVAAQIGAALLILAGVALLVSGRKSERLPLLMTVWVLIFLVLIILSSLFSSNPPEAFPQLKKSWVMLCLFPLLAFSGEYSRKTTIELFILGTTLASVLALFRYFTGAVDRAAPFSGGYTTLALFEAAALPLALWKYSQYRNSSKKWLYLVFGIMMVLGLIFTKTRAGWVAAFVGVMIMGLSLNRKRAMIGLLLSLVLLLAIPKVRGIVLERFKTEKKGGVTSGRLLLYAAATDPLSRLPLLGYGPGSFGRLVSPAVLEQIGDRNIKSWHSTPLEILMESGPLSLIAFLVAALIPVRQAWRDRKKIPGQKQFRTAVLGSLTAIYLAGLTTNLLRDFLIFSLLIFLWSFSLLSYNNDSGELKAAI